MNLALEDFLVLDRVRAGEAVPESLKVSFEKLIDCGVIEKAGRGRGVRHILSRALYKHVGEAGTYTRRKGLDEEHNQQLVLHHIRHCGSKGATMAEFEQVLPNKTRTQISALLRRMKARGYVHVEGKTKGARWHLAEEEQGL